MLSFVCYAFCHWRASPIASLVFEGGVRLVRNCDEATGACACGHAQFGGRQPHLKRALYVLRLAGARSARPRSRRILGIHLVGALVLAYALACVRYLNPGRFLTYSGMWLVRIAGIHFH